MLTLASKLKRDDGLKGSRTSATASDSTRRVSVRDRLLVKGTCKVHFPDPNKLHCFQLTVTPASQSEMPDQDLAPQHHRDGRHMSKFTERTFDRRHRLGSHKDVKGCCLGIKLFVYCKYIDQNPEFFLITLPPGFKHPVKDHTEGLKTQCPEQHADPLVPVIFLLVRGTVTRELRGLWGSTWGRGPWEPCWSGCLGPLGPGRGLVPFCFVWAAVPTGAPGPAHFMCVLTGSPLPSHVSWFG
uniref:Uncharacterized protein n=1 Tax=Felis catus TaxID=9685 RepID=A0ABI7WZN2_FELCA